MDKRTTATIRVEAPFLITLTNCWVKARRERPNDVGERFRQLLVDRLNLDLAGVNALLDGCETLAAYATADRPDDDAIAEEEAAVVASRAAVRTVFEARLQARIDRIDGAGHQVRCTECERFAESQGFRRRKWSSSVGEIGLARRYSHCGPCGLGRSVAQEQLALGEGRCTPQLAESITKLATVVPYKMACGLASTLIGAEVSVHGAERLVAERAEYVAIKGAEDAAALCPWDSTGLQRQITRPVGAVKEAPNVAYLEMDGVFVMAREEDVERSIVAPAGARGGKGRRYNVDGREVKNAILYRGDMCADEGPGRGCLLEKRYVSFLGHWKLFALRVWVMMLLQRFDQASTLVVLSDGADWIRRFCDWLPSRPLMILDLFHVKHRIWEVARAVHPGDKAAETGWARAQIERIERGCGKDVVDALRFLKTPTAPAKELVGELATYLGNNLDRMNYPKYREMGLRVGSGAIESTNYHVTGARLKQQGMRWTELGAADMAMLRADLFNGRWRARTREMLAA